MFFFYFCHGFITSVKMNHTYEKNSFSDREIAANKTITTLIPAKSGRNYCEFTMYFTLPY
jgi:hypothetical protein